MSTTPAAVTPKQGATIGLLVAALAGVWMFGQPTPEQSESSETAAASAAPRRSAEPDAADVPTLDVARWGRRPVEQVARHNPFQPLNPVARPLAEPDPVEVAEPDPDEAAAAQKAAEEERLDNLRIAWSQWSQQRVRVIVKGEKMAAVVGTRIVHVGDVIDGIRIVSIDPDGVMVELVQPDRE